MTSVLVIGATGNVGGKVLNRLVANGIQARALVRNPDVARLPPEVEIVRGDLEVPESLDRCLAGIETVFLVWTAPSPTPAFALERIAKHARRIVYLSAPLKTPHPLFRQPNPSRTLAEQIERLIEASGLEWTFLRPGMFASNALRWWAPQIRAGNTVRWPHLEAPTAPVDERDIAEVAIHALVERGHSGADYVLTGPQSLSQRAQIEMIGHVVGRPLMVEEIPPDEARRELLSTMPLPVVNMLLDAWGAAIGEPAYVTSMIADVTGNPARSFLNWITDHRAAFQ